MVVKLYMAPGVKQRNLKLSNTVYNHFLNSLFSNFAIFLIPAAGFIRDRPFYEPGFQRGFQIILSEGRPV